jgi:transcriptional regulator with XRE-family HTH domain
VKSEAEFASRLRSWRRRRGWSQIELAGRAGISQRHLSFLQKSANRAAMAQRADLPR